MKIFMIRRYYEENLITMTSIRPVILYSRKILKAKMIGVSVTLGLIVVPNLDPARRASLFRYLRTREIA